MTGGLERAGARRERGEHHFKPSRPGPTQGRVQELKRYPCARPVRATGPRATLPAFGAPSGTKGRDETFYGSRSRERAWNR